MEPTYVSEAEKRRVIPFVPSQDGVRIYPDQVKVSVALDDGEVVGFEALGYLMAHTERRSALARDPRRRRRPGGWRPAWKWTAPCASL